VLLLHVRSTNAAVGLSNAVMCYVQLCIGLVLSLISVASHLEKMARAVIKCVVSSDECAVHVLWIRCAVHVLCVSCAALQLFGFKKPIAHAMYLVARLEADMSAAGEPRGHSVWWGW
jgi:hypothetical protein